MPGRRVPLPRAAQQYLRTREGRWSRRALTLLHRWMSARDLSLSSLTPTHLDQFWQEQRRKNLAPSTWHVRRCLLHKYLYWLHQEGLLHFCVDPPRLRHMRRPLPDIARRFLARRESRGHAPVVRNFHDWLSRKRIDLDELTPAHIKAFLRRPIARPLSKSSCDSLHQRLEPYLLWLHDEGHIRFATDRGVRRPFALPDRARAFIDAVRPVRKLSTVDNYVAALRDLHAWLAAQGIALDAVGRADMERWLKSLSDRGLAPSTRNARICYVRLYLLWLAERGEIGADPHDLLRVADLPKLPTYLPRPFPPEADHELQRRFQQAGTVYGQALFLMRRAGVRIGELVRLEPACLDEDMHGNVFLKVPLGKLDNERLVPLDEEAQQVARALQRLGPRRAPYLLLPELSRDKVTTLLSAALKQAAHGLDIPGPVVSHRLRHSYATELLNAGMSLIGLMRLLGHRSIRMTMRYAALTQQTVVKDYFAARAKLSSRYQLPPASTPAGDPDPDRMLRDVIAYLRNRAGKNGTAHRLITRLHNLRRDIARLSDSPS